MRFKFSYPTAVSVIVVCAFRKNCLHNGRAKKHSLNVVAEWFANHSGVGLGYLDTEIVF
jgi:hypothetical protein